MLGTRGIWQQGWKAVTIHGLTSGLGNFDRDEGELYHADTDRAEAPGGRPDQYVGLELEANALLARGERLPSIVCPLGVID